MRREGQSVLEKGEGVCSEKKKKKERKGREER